MPERSINARIGQLETRIQTEHTSGADISDTLNSLIAAYRRNRQPQQAIDTCYQWQGEIDAGPPSLRAMIFRNAGAACREMKPPDYSRETELLGKSVLAEFSTVTFNSLVTAYRRGRWPEEAVSLYYEDGWREYLDTNCEAVPHAMIVRNIATACKEMTPPDYGREIELLRRSLELEFSDRALTALFTAYRNINQASQVIAEYQRYGEDIDAIADPRSHAIVLRSVATAYGEQSTPDYYGEMAILEQVLNLEFSGQTFTALVTACRNAGRPERALTQYQRWIETIDTLSESSLSRTMIFTNLATACGEMAPPDYEKQIELLRQAIRVHFDDQTLATLFTAYSNSNRPTQTIAEYQQWQEAIDRIQDPHSQAIILNIVAGAYRRQPVPDLETAARLQARASALSLRRSLQGDASPTEDRQRPEGGRGVSSDADYFSDEVEERLPLSGDEIRIKGDDIPRNRGQRGSRGKPRT